MNSLLERSTSGRLVLPGGEDPGDCTSCGVQRELSYLCEACGVLTREPARLDHFARLGLPRTYALDKDQLEEAYLKLSRLLHPDRRVREGAAVQAKAMVLSARLNEAYTTLKDDVSRAEHLLALAGGPSGDQDRTTPPGFLMEQLELREAAEEATTPDALRALLDQVSPARAAAKAKVAELLTGACFPSQELCRKVRVELNTLRYWNTLQAELEEKLAQHDA